MAIICCLSDSHLGYRHRLKTQRLRDYERAFYDAINRIRELKPEILILGGDMTHYPRPDPKSMRLLLRELINLADSMHIIACIGNHEIEGHLGTTYTPILSDLHENIHILTTENPHISLKISGKTIGLHGFQYIRDRKMAEETLLEISENVKKNDNNILCIHQGIEKYLDPFEISIRTMREIAQKYDLILLGHVHKHQRIMEISDITPAFYIGSIERISFNEWKNKNGFLVFRNFDFENPEFIEIKSAEMRVVKERFGKKTPIEINSYIEKIILANKNTECLQIGLEGVIDGDYLDVIQDWENRFSEFTILDVNVIPTMTENEIQLENIEINRKLIEEYFEKTGLKEKKELMDACIRLYEKYCS